MHSHGCSSNESPRSHHLAAGKTRFRGRVRGEDTPEWPRPTRRLRRWQRTGSGASAMCAAACIVMAAIRAASGEDLAVTGGAQQSNSAPVSYYNVTVSGQGGGVFSTYTVDAAFEALGGFTVSDGAQFVVNADTTLANMATLSNGAALHLNSGRFQTPTLLMNGGATMLRGTGSGSLRTERLEIHGLGTSLALQAGDEIHGGQDSYITSGATVTNTGVASIDGGMKVWFSNGGVRPTFNSNTPVTFSKDLYLYQGRLNVNANTTFAGGDVLVADSQLFLNSGTLFTNAALKFFWSGQLSRSAGFYSANSLHIDDGAAIDYRPGDALDPAGDVRVGGGATLSLGRHLDTSLLFLNTTGGISRTTQSLRLGRFEVRNGSALTLQAGDEIHGGAANIVGNIATVTNAGMSSINGSLQVNDGDGTNRSVFNSNVPVVFSGGLDVYGGRLNVNANTTFAGGNATIRADGQLMLSSGTLTTAGTLEAYWNGRIIRSGGFYSVNGLTLYDGATIDYRPGDSIGGGVALGGPASRLTQYEPLDISSLAINPGSDLVLANFSGSGYGIDHWALSLPGDARSMLLGYLADGRMTYSGVNAVDVAFEATVGRTFVALPTLLWDSGGGVWSTSPADTPWVGGEAFAQRRKVRFGDDGSGTVTVSGTVAPAAFTVGGSADYTFVAAPGNQIVGTTSLVKSGAGTATFIGPNAFSGGTVIEAGTLRIGHDDALGSGAIALNGGTIAAADGTARSMANAVSVGGDVTIGDATGTGAITFTGPVSLGNATRTITTVADVTFAGVVGNGGLTKAGPGTLRLTAANTFTGQTTVDAGTLALSGSAALASVRVVVGPGAILDRTTSRQIFSDLVVNGRVTASGDVMTVLGTFTGTGTIDGTTKIAGIHAPGNSPGTQVFTGDLVYEGAAPRFQWELAANTTTLGIPAMYDRVTVGGDLTFGSPTLLDLIFNTPGSTVNWSDGFWSTARSWTVFDVAGSLVGLGNFTIPAHDWLDSNGVLLSSVRGGGGFELARNGQDVLLTFRPAGPGAIPEIDPAGVGAVLALVTGVLGLWERRRPKAA